MSTGVKITEHFAQRIASTVRRVEAMPSASAGGKIPVRFEERPIAAGGGAVIEATFTGGWIKGQEKQIRFLANTATTATAVNLIRSIPISTGQAARLCTVAARSTSTPAYVLLNSEC